MKAFLESVRKLESDVESIYIYGAGLYGQNIYKFLKKNELKIEGFIVTKIGKEREVLGLPIYSVDDIQFKNEGVIIGANKHNTEEIAKILSYKGVEDKKIIYGNEYIDKNGSRGGYDGIPMIEVTTKIGCGVDCKYCPQDILLSKYFEYNKKRESVMSLETFRLCVDKLPNECRILFSGMAEPFLNPNCMDMLKIACESGRKVDLYTTLVGTDMADIREIAKLPLSFMTLHVADKNGFAKIPVTQEYYEKVEFLINAKKADGSPLVNMCNSQTEPDSRVEEICRDKYHILTTMLDRAGNLNDSALFSKRCLSGPIFCSLCGEKLHNNILLPDGTVLLCCMDYEMKHVLGNLKEESYESIFMSKEKKRVMNGMAGDETIDILCRKCSCANNM